MNLAGEMEIRHAVSDQEDKNTAPARDRQARAFRTLSEFRASLEPKRMARSRKINLGKVRASLDTKCPKCGFTITPDLVKRVDFERIECPKCGEKFQPRCE
jgi:predicted RNA-binding Zn-ribbon protein involved in translation (DUF1610 family)